MFGSKQLLLTIFFSMSLGSVIAQKPWTRVKEELVFTNPPFKSCHASTIVETQNGKLLMACFGGTAEGQKDVSIWLCGLNSKSHTPRAVANGVVNDTLHYAAWNPVLFKEHNGKLFLFYKVGPNPREWWGMVKTSTDNGITWSAPVRLPNGILGAIKNKPVQLTNGIILSPSSVEEKSGRWKAHIELSADKGRSWRDVQLDTSKTFDVIQPSILIYKNHTLQVLCRSKQGNIIQAWSYNNGKTWSKLSKTSLLNPNSGIDAVTLKSGKQLVVYNPDVPGKDWFNGRAKLNLACSTDGKTWKDVAILENGDKQEYSYPAIIQTSDGLIHITYTYDRHNIKHVVFKESDL
jgi:alpha-L-fucosidase